VIILRDLSDHRMMSRQLLNLQDGAGVYQGSQWRALGTMSRRRGADRVLRAAGWSAAGTAPRPGILGVHMDAFVDDDGADAASFVRRRSIVNQSLGAPQGRSFQREVRN
jgi:hypothetical protein